MSLFLLFLCLFGWMHLVSHFCRGFNSVYLACACGLITLVLYVFAIFQILTFGIITVCSIGALGCFCAIIESVYYPHFRISSLFSLMQLLAIFILSFIASWGAQYWTWDEFSHWGAVLEYLTILKNLPTSSDILLFPHYVPGLTIFRYFGVYLLNGTGISAAYFLNWVFVFSVIYSLTYSPSKTKWLVSYLLVLFSYFIFFQSLSLALYVDPLQSLLFACAMVYSSREDPKYFKLLIVFLPVIVLVKHVGLIFSLCVISNYLFMSIYLRHQSFKSVILRSSVLLSTVLVAYSSWAIYLSKYSISVSVLDVSKLQSGFGFINSLIDGLTFVLNSRFLHAQFLPSMLNSEFTNFLFGSNVPYWSFALCVLALMFFLVCISTASFRLKYYLLSMSLLINLAYISFLALICIMSPWGGDVFSFSRYALVSLFATFVWVVVILRDDLQSLLLTSTLFCAFTISLYVGPSLVSVFPSAKRLPVNVNQEYEDKARALNDVAKPNSSVWFINDQSLMLGYFIFRMKSLKFKFLDYSVGYNVYTNNSLDYGINLDYRIKLFQRNLCKVDYLVVDTMPDLFWNQFSSSFNVPRGHLYKVNRRALPPFVFGSRGEINRAYVYRSTYYNAQLIPLHDSPRLSQFAQIFKHDALRCSANLVQM